MVGSFLAALICPHQHQRAPSSTGSQHSKHGKNILRYRAELQKQKQTHEWLRTSLQGARRVASLEVEIPTQEAFTSNAVA